MSEPITPRTKAGRAFLVVDHVYMSRATLVANIRAIEAEVLEGVAERVREALEREPTLGEVKTYGMDGNRTLIANNFNTLQWRLDLVRDVLALFSTDRETT